GVQPAGAVALQVFQNPNMIGHGCTPSISCGLRAPLRVAAKRLFATRLLWVPCFRGSLATDETVQDHRESMRILQSRHAFAVISRWLTTLQRSRESMAPGVFDLPRHTGAFTRPARQEVENRHSFFITCCNSVRSSFMPRCSRPRSEPFVRPSCRQIVS